MAHNDKLDGARNAFALHFTYVDSVAEEIGVDEAIALSEKVDEDMGSIRGQMIREQAGQMEFDAPSAASAARESIKNDFGIVSNVIEESDRRVVMQCGRCPVYEAARMVGMDNDEVRTQCCGGAIGYMDSLVKQLNPRLRYRLKKFRSSADDHCEEEVVMD